MVTALIRTARFAITVALTLAALAAAARPLAFAGSRGQNTPPGLQQRSGYEDMSASLQALQRDMGLNPAWLSIEQGRAAWNATAPAQRSCASCHGPLDSMARSAAAHPRWHAASNRPRTVEDQVLECRRRQEGSGMSQTRPQLGDGMSLALSAALVAASQGQALSPDPHPALAPWVEQGQQLWHQRMGQLNLSCAQCHDQRSGQRLGGTRIPQGHDTGYPLYRMQWQGLGSLERRLRGCMSGVRAEPFAPGADEWRALAAYMHRRSAGLLMEAGAIRP